MSILRAKMDTAQYRRHMRALNRIIRFVSQQEELLPLRQATGYTNLLRYNLVAEKFVHPPYSTSYAAWKAKQPWAMAGSWKLKGDLLRALTIFKDGGGAGWRGGIPAGVMDSGGKSMRGKGKPKPIAMYARTLEKGLGRQKKRPVFVPTLVEYKQGGAVRELNQVRMQLIGKWGG